MKDGKNKYGNTGVAIASLRSPSKYQDTDL